MYWAFGGRRPAPPPAPEQEQQQQQPATSTPPRRRGAGAEMDPPAASLFESDAFFRLGRVLSQAQSPPQPQQQVRKGQRGESIAL